MIAQMGKPPAHVTAMMILGVIMMLTNSAEGMIPADADAG